ncbi:Rap1a/Tai family immunity protein [Dongia rigui]|uniref:Rap1a/Tai family immunity protein n=1 Tax=Dongia rigui TaxID=940149 RepID=A0ABU5E3D0_9PROT|nr:Rap1a/Tai family immunity protein [Dongia rigui]MDY0874103.1 Rap1a/Tai family immunity protein [Dongia rigui]
MIIVCFFLLLFALIAALAKSWRYCAGFVLAGIAIWISAAFLDSHTTTAREILADCDASRQEGDIDSTSCAAIILINFAPSQRKGVDTCIFGDASFETHSAAIRPRLSRLTEYEELADAVVAWMRSHPEQLDLPASQVIGYAVASRFPCNTEQQ